MPLPNPKEIRDYVAANISAFHETRLARLEELKLKKILRRKNPYLFKAKNILTAEALVRVLLDAHCLLKKKRCSAISWKAWVSTSMPRRSVARSRARRVSISNLIAMASAGW